MLEDALKKQDAILSRQIHELAEATKLAEDLKSQLKECQAKCEILNLRAQSQAILCIVGDGEPWLLEINRHGCKQRMSISYMAWDRDAVTGSISVCALNPGLHYWAQATPNNLCTVLCAKRPDFDKEVSNSVR